MWSFRKLVFYFQYLHKPRWDTGITPPEVVDFAADHSPGCALDLGCGTGTNAIYLARLGWQVIGVDYVKTAIRAARKKAKQAGAAVEFLCDDVTQLKGISGDFDLVLDIGCLHSLPPDMRKAYYHRLKQLLRPGGTYLLYAFTGSNISGQVGLNEQDFQLLVEFLRLKEKQDGSDHGRPSAWFTWQKAI